MWILPCYLLLSVTVSGLKLQRSSEDIPEVHLNLLHLLDPSGFSVTWDPIKTRNESNTILGIKVKAWKTPCVVKTVYKVSDRLTKIVKLEPQTYNSTTVPADTPAYVAIVTADKVTAIIPHIQREQWYHVRALAFTSTAEGKHSNSFNFKVNSNNENDLRMSCEKVMSETPVSAVIL